MKRCGFTLVEGLVAAGLMAMVSLMAGPFMHRIILAMTSNEAHVGLKEIGQQINTRIQHRVSQSFRLIDNSPIGQDYWNRRQSVIAPAAMPGSHLPTIEVAGSLSPASAAFVAASVGNILFFVAAEPAVDVAGPLGPYRVDTFRFYAYYLALDQSRIVDGQAARRVWEWRSVRYANADAVLALSDPTVRANALALLGQPENNVTLAWAPSAENPAGAFYFVSGGTLVHSADAFIQEASAEDIAKTILGVSQGTYRYGISPNTTGDPLNVVPRFGVAAGNFPSGFEILMVGPDTGRQVMLRVALAAEGALAGPLHYSEILMAWVGDKW